MIQFEMSRYNNKLFVQFDVVERRPLAAPLFYAKVYGNRHK